MRIALIGANGQLGSDMGEILRERNEVSALTHKEIEICDHEGTRCRLTELSPEVIINTAAFHKVDVCEDEVERSFAVNATAVHNLADFCRMKDITLVHISTDYVFGGEKREPYTEDDRPNPHTVYGVSKVAGEFFVRNVCRRHFLVRSGGLYGVAGSRGKGGNFVETMLRLAREGKEIRVVTDQVVSPTFTRDLAGSIAGLVEGNSYGLYHLSNAGQCSWYEFAKAIFELSGISSSMAGVSSEELATRAKRPLYSALTSNRAGRVGLQPLRHWRSALQEYLTIR